MQQIALPMHRTRSCNSLYKPQSREISTKREFLRLFLPNSRHPRDKDPTPLRYKWWEALQETTESLQTAEKSIRSSLPEKRQKADLWYRIDRVRAEETQVPRERTGRLFQRIERLWAKDLLWWCAYFWRGVFWIVSTTMLDTGTQTLCSKNDIEGCDAQTPRFLWSAVGCILPPAILRLCGPLRCLIGWSNCLYS